MKKKLVHRTVRGGMFGSVYLCNQAIVATKSKIAIKGRKVTCKNCLRKGSKLK